ncbi:MULTISPECIES: NUDIX hydrolase [Acinetobacter]|uniref:NUDIX hydrolase n=1 Tax=Acinetobacter TaxID=469 RepID=UPI000F74301C|nr:CoA pyrophosphatase [Acinetobacter haemolyticus]RSN78261.1 CoA pyrophosphatase [Acinetobacter haemolyticus]
MSPMEEASLIQLLEQRLRFSKRIQQADAAVLIAITQELQPRVLLTRRSMQLSQHAGEVSFPGGKRDPSDTSNIVVALREAQEETALNPFDVKLLGDLPIQRARSGLSVKPIVGLIPAHVDLIPQPSEIDRIFFADLKALIEAPPLPYEVRLARQSIYFPSMQVESEIVWGLTARMLISLFQYGLGYQKNWPFLVNPPDFGLSKF